MYVRAETTSSRRIRLSDVVSLLERHTALPPCAAPHAQPDLRPSAPVTLFNSLTLFPRWTERSYVLVFRYNPPRLFLCQIHGMTSCSYGPCATTWLPCRVMLSLCVC
eukprot:scaffold50923_cov62-Phaeocystis_antarctica.AAC.1